MAIFDGFTESEFTHDGFTRQVFRAGSGPAVIVIHEAPGLHPGVVEFARRVLECGFTVFMPSLFGKPGKEFGMAYSLRSIGRCLRHARVHCVRPRPHGTRHRLAPPARG